MQSRLFAIALTLAAVDSASVQQVDPLELPQPADYRRRTVGAGLVGFGLALTLTSATGYSP